MAEWTRVKLRFRFPAEQFRFYGNQGKQGLAPVGFNYAAVSACLMLLPPSLCGIWARASCSLPPSDVGCYSSIDCPVPRRYQPPVRPWIAIDRALPLNHLLEPTKTLPIREPHLSLPISLRIHLNPRRKPFHRNVLLPNYRKQGNYLASDGFGNLGRGMWRLICSFVEKYMVLPGW